MENITFELLALLLFTGLLSGLIDAMAGGGGLIALPILLMSGISPAQALATNKLQGTFGSGTAAYTFIKKGYIDTTRYGHAILTTFIGAAIGSVLILMIDPYYLTQAIPVLLIAVCLYFAFSKNLGDQDHTARMQARTYANSVAPSIGFYDGFLGPGTGSFFVASISALRGYNLRRATALTKLLNFTSNVASLIIFVLGGSVVWALGLTMAVGQLAGAQIGARLVITKGAKLVRPVLIVSSLVICSALILKDDQHPIRLFLIAFWQ